MGKNGSEPSLRDDENRSAKNESFSISVETPEIEKSIREFCPQLHCGVWQSQTMVRVSGLLEVWTLLVSQLYICYTDFEVII